MDRRSTRTTSDMPHLPAGSGRRDAARPSDLADAPGRTLSAGVSRAPGEGRQLPRPLLQSGAGRRGHAAADPALRLRCGDPVLRHPGRARRRSARSSGSSRAKDRGSNRSPMQARLGRDRSRCCRRAGSGADPARPCARVQRSPARGDGSHRLLRRALDRGDLYGRRARHAGPGAGQGALRAATQPSSRRSIDRIVEASIDYLDRADRCRRRCGADLRQLGGRRSAPRISSAGASRRRGGSSRASGRVHPAGPHHRLSAWRRPADPGLCRGRRASMPSGSKPRSTASFAREAIQSLGAGPGPSRSAGAAGRRSRAGSARSRRSWPPSATGPFIFNLGHGILPDTPIAHVERLLEGGAGLRIRTMYEWIKAFHVIAVIAWMAGMLYLPRLMVYHAEAQTGSIQSETFKIMERRLLKGIINPAMIADLGARPLPRLVRVRLQGRLAARQDPAGLHPLRHSRLCSSGMCGPSPRTATTKPAALLPHPQRGAGRADDRHRHSRHRQAVLTADHAFPA